MNNLDKPPYDYEKEYQYTRQMANEINHKSINTLIVLSTGAIVFTPQLVNLCNKDAKYLKEIFIIGNIFFVISLISGIIQLMILHNFWEKLTIYHDKLLRGQDVERPKTHSPVLFQYIQFVSFIFGIIFLLVLVLL
ncbi:MAG: hypothetical protein RMJ17_04225 [Candidatus Aenigmarchaeota archaeon]|nr:hypothetical protein [Candidatus Aenigmarchaeota archaeon]MDW8149764.1 hypothetical protein [Candidatus Aenigmarchaeota archaeon]